jgi:DNA-binding protein H-NS
MIWNDKTKGFALGIGAAILVPIVYELAVTVGRPAAKKLIKTGMKLAEQGMEKVAEAGEHFEDLVAEVREEVDEEMMAGAVSIDPEDEVREKAAAKPAAKKKSAPKKASTKKVRKKT